MSGFIHHNILQPLLKNLLDIHPASSGRKISQHLTKIFKMECIITIEIGTGAIRIVAFDLKGAVLGSSKGSYPTFHSRPDFSEQDPEQIFITMLYILKNFLNEKIHPRKQEVVCICFSSAMHSVLPIDKNGVPLGNAIVWSDNRAKKEAGDLKNSSLGRSLYKTTGTPIHAM